MPLTLATFNVKDLFDATDASSRAQLDAKLDTLAQVLVQADADVVALQEVGSAEVLRELAARAAAKGGGRPYGEAVVGDADARGIRNAILARVPILRSAIKTAAELDFPGFVVGDPPPFGARIPLRRAVVHARVDGGAMGPIDVLVVHFKSNRSIPLRDATGAALLPTTGRAFAEGNVRSLVCRAAEALFVRGLVDELLEGDPTRHVVVAGDLNDHAASLVVQTVAGGGAGALVRCAEKVPAAARFSILRYGAPQQIDHVLATPGLHSRVTAVRFLNEGLRDHSCFTEEMPASPDSDHAALVVSFA